MSTGQGCFPGVMNGTNQAIFNIIIMKWIHLVSKGFIHKGNDEEVLFFSDDLLGTFTEQFWSPEAIKRGWRLVFEMQEPSWNASCLPHSFCTRAMGR